MSPVLEASRAKRAAKQDELDKLLEAPTAESRALNDEESEKFEKLAEQIRQLDREIGDLEADEKRKADAAAVAAESAAGAIAGGYVRSEQHTYELRGEHSYLRDLAAISIPAVAGHFDGREAAEERMTQHHQEITVDAKSDPEIRRRLHEIQRTPESLTYRDRKEFEQRVNPNTTAGTGGELVPPLWAMNLTAPYLRPTRVAANRVTNMPLPPGIDVINVPRITLGSITAVQSANAAPVASQDIQTSSVSAPVNTLAGQQDVSLQLLEQSPLSINGVVFDDLSRAYDQNLDQQILYGSGANGQHTGILNVASTASPTVGSANASAVTVASATFWDGSTAGTQYRSVVKGVNQIENLTFSALPPTAVWAHPRRINSWAYAADSATGRPLFIPSRYSPYNVVGLAESTPQPEGVAGELFGLPVIKDGNIPTTMNGTATTGGTADAVVVLNESVVLLYEGTMRMRTLPEVLSGTLAVRFQVYNYSAFLPTRYANAISILTGNTGLASPGF